MKRILTSSTLSVLMFYATHFVDGIADAWWVTPTLILMALFVYVTFFYTIFLVYLRLDSVNR
jgi:hypothetical protein